MPFNINSKIIYIAMRGIKVMLNHKGTITIETQRLILRRFTIEDADSMFNNWFGDSEVCEYMAWPHRKDIYETKMVIEKLCDSYNNISFYQWAVILKENNENIGVAGLSLVSEIELCGGVSYCIGKEYWGKGIATELLKAVLGFAFNTVGFNRIEAYHSIDNSRSGRVMQKAGMSFKGLVRQKYKSNRGLEDSNVYSILKEEFILNY